MKDRIISFRPFRRIGDKIVVTSYTGWRKLYTANYEGATIKLLSFPDVNKNETIYSVSNPEGLYKYYHPIKFEPLFWPANAKIRFKHWREPITFLDELPIGDDEVYSMFDCDGCPAFSHKTAVYISENYPNKIHLFEPLTADIVYEYFEKMRDELSNLKWLISPQTKNK